MTPTERRVAAIYAQILDLQTVHREDDLHDLAGDSLHAVRIALAIETAFHIGVPVDRLEQASRVSDVAAWIDAERALVRSAAPE